MAHFNKRHYEAIATVMQEYRAFAEHIQNGHARRTHASEIEARLADMFRSDNGLFNRDRFLHACLPGSNVKAKTAHLKIA